jgi:hypothetical protein
MNLYTQMRNTYDIRHQTDCDLHFCGPGVGGNRWKSGMGIVQINKKDVLTVEDVMPINYSAFIREIFL